MKISESLRNDIVTEVALFFDLHGAAFLQIRTGSAPTHTEDADSGVLLATLTFNNPAFAAHTGGVATAGPISDDVFADATGTAGHWRIKDGDGTVLMQGTCGTSGADINFDSVSFTIGDRVSIASLTLTMPASP